MYLVFYKDDFVFLKLIFETKNKCYIWRLILFCTSPTIDPTCGYHQM